MFIEADDKINKEKCNTPTNIPQDAKPQITANALANEWASDWNEHNLVACLVASWLLPGCLLVGIFATDTMGLTAITSYH